jgi:hypothetical protein
MKKYRKKSMLGLFLVAVLPVPALAEGNRAETKYFSAEIVNVRRANTGNVMVTVKFTPKIDEGSSLEIYSDVEKKYNIPDPCPIAQATLIDGNGDEHRSRNCLPAYDTRGLPDYPYIGGMQIPSGSEASFVFKFGLAGSSSESLQNMNVTMPIRYQYCYQFVDQWNTKQTTCNKSPTTLSFYGVNAN